MMKVLNHTISCTEINRCSDEVDGLDAQREKTCDDAVACYNFLLWKNDECCQKKGCFLANDVQLLNCNKKIVKINEESGMRNGYQGFCCNDADFCNGIQQTPSNLINILIICGLVVFFLSIALMCLLISIKRKKSSNKVRKKIYVKKNGKANYISNSISNPFVSSGSGAGFPLLMPRTLAKDIRLECQIGNGKFGEVWRGNYQNRKVAVKLFRNTDYDSWKKETEIYNHYSLASEFILKYLGSDITSSESCTTEFWIVLDYHELGSLYDYLQKNLLNKDQALSIMNSAISGLVHLHDLYEFTTSKPSIAHRDLKSKNLLMKSRSVVCIADFGLSVTSKEFETNRYENFNIRSGTKRYMPPEVLDESVNVKNFKAFQMADVYSFSLLLWEIITHSEFNLCFSSGYKLPYYEYVGEDPSFEEMKKIVSIERKRPSLDMFMHKSNDYHEKILHKDAKIIGMVNKKCKELEIIIGICELIRNCWQDNSSKRYDHINIKKKFDEIIKSSNLFT